MATIEETTAGKKLYSLSRLGLEFDLHRDTVRKRLRGVSPCGTLRKNPAYTLAKAAPYLIDDRHDPEQEEKRIDPDKLPPEDQNQYWAAQIKRLSFEEKEGDLWSTEKVADIFSAYNKTVALTLRALPERIHKVLPLEPKQKDFLRKEIARLMIQLNEKVVEDFGGSADLPDD